MAQQQHHSSFRVALAPSNDVPRQMTLVEYVQIDPLFWGPNQCRFISLPNQWTWPRHGKNHKCMMGTGGDRGREGVSNRTKEYVERLHSRAKSLVAEFRQGGGHYIEEAINLDREALQLCPTGHPKRHLSLTSLAHHLLHRYNQFGKPSPSIEKHSTFVTQGHPERSMSLDNLAFGLLTRYEQLGGMEDLDEAIILDREALDLRPQGHPDRWMSLHNLSVGLSSRYRQLWGVEDLDEAIVLRREALDLCVQGHPHRRYKQLGGMEDLDEAIFLGREALDLRPQGHPDRWMSLHSLSVGLSSRYRQLWGMEDLDEAIVLGREALDLCPQGHPHRSGSLNNLAVHLSSRFGTSSSGEWRTSRRPLSSTREALDLRLQGHPDRWMSLNNLAVHLSSLYEQLGGMEDLDEAIVLAREALNHRPQGGPDRSMSLGNLGSLLSTRYNQLGGMEVLDVAIVLDREALDLRPQGHPGRSGEWRNLDEAIVLTREALDLCPQGHPGRWMSLNDLGFYLSSRYDQLGGMEDLDEAIVLARDALDLHPQGHPDRWMSLNNLGFYFSSRYKQLGGMEDLDEAIFLGREALDLRPQGHPGRCVSLGNLGIYLSTRYKQLGGMEDLDEAIVLRREALDLRPQGHPDRSISLNNLGFCLSTRYKQLGGMEDLEVAIVLDRAALDLRLQGHPDRWMSLNNLALDLSRRYDQLGGMEDLDEAIVLDREALDLLPQGYPDRSMSLKNLARNLCDRFMHLGELKDKEEVFNLYTRLTCAPQIVSTADLSAAREWIRMAHHFHHPTILLAYESSLQLLTQYLATSTNCTSSLAVDAFSASLYERAPAHAVELLEQGRGVFWSQLTRLRSPLDDLVISDPVGKTLANDFAKLALLIRNTLDSTGAGQHERLCHLNVDMHEVVTEVRELPGLSRFLLPPLFPDLQRAASGGPVIIVNASEYSCDALVVLLDRDPVHIQLQITREGVQDLSTELHALAVRTKTVDMTRPLAAFLRKIWDQIVSPIVDSLQTIHPARSRIWWCPTAEFSTTHSIVFCNSTGGASSPSAKPRRLARSELASVGEELDNIRSVRRRPLATFTRIDGEESCISRVVEELGQERLGAPCVLWSSKLKEAVRVRVRSARRTLYDPTHYRLRFGQCRICVSLCVSIRQFGDEESPDEVIHLASAMQFAGFRSVIGTMWAVNDGETNKITSTFYKHMVDESGRLDHTRAAFALNKTMESVDVPFDQRILYVHLGA
ncbi:hypothetical protein HD554DRAFT_2327256 [Boletus coccyginus]|nr:hypothetical protein HD554DRAFT_2327256 [Boletus coccyginus]